MKYLPAPAAALAAAALAAVLATSGCSQNQASTSASGSSAASTSAAPSQSATPIVSASASASAATSTSATATSSAPVPSTTKAVPSMSAAAAGCPVTSGTLLAALTANKQLNGELIQPVKLLTPSCYDGYATVMTAPKPDVDTPAVLFHYSASTKTWTAVNLGTSDICTGTVPAADIPHLKYCN